MIRNKRILAIIPARGGSKGVPRKNIRMVAGKPLLAWTVEAAKKSKYIDRIITSTDDQEIADIAMSWGSEVPFLRPAELARDKTPGIAPVLHVIEKLGEEYDYIVLLQPTSPLRNVDDIDGCITQIIQHGAPICVSVCVPDKSPFWMYTTDESGRLMPLLSEGEIPLFRQDVPTLYSLNGAIYVGRTEHIRQCRSFLTPEAIAYVMPKERSLDIDTEFDLKICDFLLSEAAKNEV